MTFLWFLPVGMGWAVQVSRDSTFNLVEVLILEEECDV